MKIIGAENMTADQLRFEIQRGARLVCYNYCISLLVITFKRNSDIYLIPPEGNAVAKGLPWSLLTLVMGWWGIPWGPIFSIQSLIVNFKGGKNLTENFTTRISAPTTTVAEPARF
jgi:hypothetical protein